MLDPTVQDSLVYAKIELNKEIVSLPRSQVERNNKKFGMLITIEDRVWKKSQRARFFRSG